MIFHQKIIFIVLSSNVVQLYVSRFVFDSEAYKYNGHNQICIFHSNKFFNNHSGSILYDQRLK